MRVKKHLFSKLEEGLFFSSIASSLSSVCCFAKLAADWEQVSWTIHDERICRLQDKIRKIDKGLSEKISELDPEQAQQVKDYFFIKMTEMMTKKTNQVRVVHV